MKRIAANRKSAILYMILCLSIVLRIITALYLGRSIETPQPKSDQISYHTLALRLLEKREYTFPTGWYPFTPPNTTTAFWSFLYPIFLAAVYAIFGVHPLAARLVQAVLGGLLLPWMVYRLTRRLFPQREGTALLAALLTAGYAYFILHAAMLMTETFFVVLVVWSLEVSIRVAREWGNGHRVPWRWILELCVSLGLATLMRQSILPWVPVLFLVYLCLNSDVPRLQRLKALVFASALLCAFILPWTIRNYRVYGEFLLLNSNTGYAMYSAQHPMHGTSFDEYAAAPLPEDLRGLNEAQMDRILLRRGIEFILEDPGRYALLCLSRVRAYFEFWPSRDTPLLHNLGRLLSFGLYLPFMIYGYVLAFRGRLFGRGNWLIPLFVVVYSMMHILTWAMVRYRLPVDAASMPLAALGLNDALGHARGIRFRRNGRVCSYRCARGPKLARSPSLNPHLYSLWLHPKKCEAR